MQISETRASRVLFVELDGRLDIVSESVVDAHLVKTIASGELRVVIDLARVAYISSIGFRVFMLCLKRMTAARGRIVMCSPQPIVRTILDAAGLTSHFPIYDSRDAASASFDA